MVKKLTVSEFLKELDISFSEFKNVLAECSLPMRDLNEDITLSEKQKVLQFLKEKAENILGSSVKPGQTKRRLLVHVQGTKGRREAINVEVRKKRIITKPLISTENLSNSIDNSFAEKEQEKVVSEMLPHLLTVDNLKNKESALHLSVNPIKSIQSLSEDLKPSSEKIQLHIDSESMLQAGMVSEDLFPVTNLTEEILSIPLDLDQKTEDLKFSDIKLDKDKKDNAIKSKKSRFGDKNVRSSTRRSELDLAGLEDLDADEENAAVFIPSEHLRSKLVRNVSPHDKKNKRGSLSNDSNVFSVIKNKKFNKQALQQKFTRPVMPVSKNIRVHEGVTVQELSEKLSLKSAALIKELMKLGVMARLNDPVEADVIELISDTLGHQITVVSANELEETFLSERQNASVIEETHERAPVVTVMGHVDHGKTSLLDFIRKTRVASGEAGGITQHLGAYRVNLPEGSVVFIDTPGHQAFTMMRARGARCTDIVVLVVAADDGIMPQTEEAIQHAKAAQVPVVVAITKCDKAGANPSKIKEGLLQHELVCEEWGGDVQVVEVSSTTGLGIDNLLKALLFQAEFLELKAPISGTVNGIVLESKMDKGRGPSANVLIQKGILKIGDMVVCGQSYGRVRQIMNELGQELKEAGPSMPVVVYGMTALPLPGDLLITINNEKKARELTDHRRVQARTLRLRETQQNNKDFWGGINLDKANELENAIEKPQKITMNVVIKADTNGTLEALKSALLGLNRDEVEVNIRGHGVGAITESDVALAQASQAMLIAFNVRPDGPARKYIEQEQVGLQYHNIIYEVIESVKADISGRLSPIKHQQLKGTAEVRAVFRSPKFGAVAGCMVSEGLITRKQSIRIVRDSKVILEAEIDSLRRGKEDVTEVRQGTECGIGVRNYSGFLIGDRIEVYDVTEIARNIFNE